MEVLEDIWQREREPRSHDGPRTVGGNLKENVYAESVSPRQGRSNAQLMKNATVMIVYCARQLDTTVDGSTHALANTEPKGGLGAVETGRGQIGTVDQRHAVPTRASDGRRRASSGT